MRNERLKMKLVTPQLLNRLQRRSAPLRGAPVRACGAQTAASGGCIFMKKLPLFLRVVAVCVGLGLCLAYEFFFPAGPILVGARSAPVFVSCRGRGPVRVR